MNSCHGSSVHSPTSNSMPVNFEQQVQGQELTDRYCRKVASGWSSFSRNVHTEPRVPLASAAGTYMHGRGLLQVLALEIQCCVLHAYTAAAHYCRAPLHRSQAVDWYILGMCSMGACVASQYSVLQCTHRATEGGELVIGAGASSAS